jgi:hypothetical protein
MSWIITYSKQIIRNASAENDHLIVKSGLRTNSLKQSRSWESNIRSVSHEIWCPLWNPNAHYRIQKSSLLDPVLSGINKTHKRLLYFLKINFTINLTFMPRSPKRPHPLACRFPCQIFACIPHFSPEVYMPWSSHSPQFGCANNIQRRVYIMKLLVM